MVIFVLPMLLLEMTANKFVRPKKGKPDSIPVFKFPKMMDKVNYKF